jgi:hypothetical protein
MNTKIIREKQGIIALALLALLALGGSLFANFGRTEVNASIQDCPNGPLRANLTGADLSGKTPSGTAQFNDKSNNELMVRVRSVNLPADTSLSVFIGDASVGQMTVPKNGNAELKLNSATGIIEGTVITVRNGETTILTGSFVCVAGGNRNTNTNGNKNTNSNANTGNANTNANTGNVNTNANTSPTVTPTITPTITPTVTPTVTPTPTVTATPTVTPTPTPTV